MKRETFEKLLRMDIVKKNFFDTPHGKYQISILIDEHEDLYFVKWKNDIVVEMVNLSDRRKAHEKLSRYESDIMPHDFLPRRDVPKTLLKDSLQGSKRDFDEYGVDT